MPKHEKMNYIEYPSRDLVATKAFFNKALYWNFVDYGPDYSAFSDEGLDGGFYHSDQCALTSHGSALIVFYSDNLEQTQQKIINAGGSICRDIFEFPGGRRFHFIEPGGNEFAVWSE
ncbi:MAG: VOC family protein [Reinekea sp.]